MNKILILAITLFSSGAIADADMQFSDGTSGVISSGRVLFGDEESAILYTEGQAHFTVIDGRRKTYMDVTPEFIEGMKSKLDAQMAQMEKMLAGMPAQQRAMVEQQMKSRMPQMDGGRKTKIERTGSNATVAGFDCEEAEIRYEDDNSVESRVCIATADELSLSSTDFRALSSAANAMLEMASVGGNRPAESDFEKLGGIPIRRTGGAAGGDSELSSIDTSDIDPSRFEIPANYKKQSIEDMMRP